MKDESVRMFNVELEYYASREQKLFFFISRNDLLLELSSPASVFSASLQTTWDHCAHARHVVGLIEWQARVHRHLS